MTVINTYTKELDLELPEYDPSEYSVGLYSSNTVLVSYCDDSETEAVELYLPFSVLDKIDKVREEFKEHKKKVTVNSE